MINRTAALGAALALCVQAWLGLAVAQQSAKPAVPAAVSIPPVATPAPRVTNAWRVIKDRWSEADEREYSDFIFRIGESGCNTVNKCMWDNANPYRGSNPAGAHFYADCADLPYFLRAYFAWKKGLPFSYVTAVSPKGSTRDIRYTLSGNRVSSRRDLTTGAGTATAVLGSMRGNISSAMFRLHPTDENTDLYPVAIQPKAIRPGTTIYDPNGHLAVVYKVEKDGRIRFIDAHPDNSLTRGTYGRKFLRARPSMGAGFKNWRPIRLTNYTASADGSLLGGVMSFAGNSEIPDFSWEQYYGTDIAEPKDAKWAAGEFLIEGEAYEYYDFVRTRMAGGSLTYQPLEELRNMMRSNCEDIKYRAEAVDIAIRAGIQNKAQPGRLPPNIYGTEGEWEDFSTPSRDARLKTAFKEKFDTIQRLVNDHRLGSKRIVYTGTSLIGDLIKIYDQEASACTISYARTDGSARTLGYEDIRKRMFLLSFDPYHCVERRWGASTPEELATCRDGAEKQAWYAAEQKLRNQIDRTYEARMDHDLASLRSPGGEGKGVDVAPVIDLRGWLQAELVSPTAPVAPASPSAAAKPQPPKKAPAGVATKTSAPVAVPAAAGSQPAVADQQQLPAQAQRRPQGDGIGSNVPVSLWKDPKDAPFSPKAAGAQPLPSLVQPAATAPATPSATPAAVRQEPSGN